MLVDSELVTIFEQVQSLLNRVDAEFLRLAGRSEYRHKEGLADDESPSICQVVEDQGRLIARDQYTVGFLGMTGIGKSQTINNILQFELLPLGTRSVPCTSTIIRIRAASPETQARVTRHFFTRDQYEAKRQAVLDQIEDKRQKNSGQLGGPLPDEPQKLVEVLCDRLEKEPEGEVAPLYWFLLRLTGAGRRDQSAKLYLDSQPKTERLNGRDDLKRQIARLGQHSHAGRGVTPKQEFENSVYDDVVLTSQLEVVFPAESDELQWGDLEIVDLPGVLAGTSQDDEVTRGFLPNLDGAILGFSEQNLDLGGVRDLLDRLRRQFKGRLRGRLWISISRMDGIAPNKLDPRNYPATFLNTVIDQLGVARLDARSVLMLGNVFHSQYHGRMPPADAIVDKFHAVKNSGGGVELPPIFEHEEFGPLRDVYRELMRDGGISRARRIVKDELAANVGRAMNIAVAAELTAAMAKLQELAKEQMARRGLNTLERNELGQWNQVFNSAVKTLNHYDPIYNDPVKKLRERLIAMLDSRCKADDDTPESDMPGIHRSLTRDLKNEASTAFGRFGDDLFKCMADWLEKRAGEMVHVAPGSNLGSVIQPRQRFAEEWSKAGSRMGLLKWLANSFESSPLSSHALAPGVYPHVMRRKIHNVIHEAVEVVNNGLRASAQAVKQKLNDLGNDNLDNDPATDDQYRQLIEQAKVLESLSAAQSRKWEQADAVVEAAAG